MCAKLFPTVLVCVFLCLATHGQVIDETSSTVLINDTTATFELAITHHAAASFRVDLQLIDTDGDVRAEISQQLQIRPGKQKHRVMLPIGNLYANLSDDLGWLRLRYRLGENTGIISLGEMMKDVFELRVSGVDRIVPGSEYRMRVRTLNPFTKTGVKGVALEGKLKLELDTEADEDEIELKAKAVANRDGIAILKFKIPPSVVFEDDPEFEITGRRNGFVQSIENDFDSEDYGKPGFFTTDKPVYQPGETFNLRGLFLDLNNTVVAGKEIELSIEDEAGAELFDETVTTSEYGIASISWQIPSSAKLGKYTVHLDGDERFTFEVTRYDLPNFVVTSESDKGYYLPADRTARITLGADYLFGKPVTAGQVRVVREKERRWNWGEQKYDSEEKGAALSGATDATGKYVATLDLSKELDELMKSEWRRYDDLQYTAYFTDTSTNRTEQKRFDIRITKEPIHVYFISYAEQHPGLPMLAYISTFYADGTPVETTVDITVKNKTVESFRTTPGGAGRIKFPIPEDVLVTRKLGLRVSARDRHGQRGTFDESLSLTSQAEAVQLETDKAIYAVGDPVNVKLASTKEIGMVYVDVLKNHVVLESRHMNLDKGRATLRIPYDDRFKGEIMIAAYTDGDRDYSGPRVRFARGIIFPERQELRIDAKFNRNTYRPGDEARLSFSIANAAGRSSESVLGITLFDKAIEERAKSNNAFGDYFGEFSKLLGLDRTFGGVTLRDLNEIDTSRPITEEMQLSAEVILAGSYGDQRTKVFHSEFNADEAHTAYSAFFKEQIPPIEKILRARFDQDQTYPRDSAGLVQILRSGGLESNQFEDPWQRTYTPAFIIDRSHLVVKLVSSGPDKRVGTLDDFEVLTTRLPYFAKIGTAIDDAITQDYFATGRHIREMTTLYEVLKKRGIDLAQMVDPWKRPYQVAFDVSGRNYVIHISSLGPDGLKAPKRWGSDDFDVANIYTDYFHRYEVQINTILARGRLTAGKTFPGSIDQFRSMLREGGFDLDTLRDGNGSPVYLTIDTKTEASPVFSIRSPGSNAADPSDDTTLGSFSRATAEFAFHTGTTGNAEVKSIDGSNAKGAIRGTVVDAMNAVVPGADVIGVEENDPDTRFVTATDSEGNFLLANLPSGKYSVTIIAPHFKHFRRDNIPVRSQRLVEIRAMLDVGTVSEVVTVIAPEYDVLNTQSATVGTVVRGPANVVFPYGSPVATPRLREYFPETLLWRPDLITDRRGRAELNFKMADNITTWKMYAVASTKNGKVGIAEKEITSFQPFFVDLDPPKFLTEGDRIALPVQVRNYTEEKKSVEVLMAKADWFSLTGAERQTLDIEPGRSQNAVFAFSADTAINAGKQRVTATAKKDADAVERPVTVRPNGQEIVQTQSKVFVGNETFRIDFPANAIAGTANAEVKVYPDLYAHVGEAVEGLLKRPYGCGEQTISSTYPNVMILKFVKADTPLRRKALVYLQTGYERLVGYQVADGGFSYWGGKDPSNYALTAYALRFLKDAAEFVDVDESVISRAEEHLAKKQNTDGSWPEGSYGGSDRDTTRTAMATAYIARAMATRTPAERNAALQKAIAYLDTGRAEIAEAYTLALFGLALLDLGDTAKAKSVADQLQKSGIRDGATTYWDLTGATPFHGWGRTGRIETTALVSQLLTRTLGGEAASGGLLYILSNKDRYGVWHSTQATVNVLDALNAIAAARGETAPQRIQVLFGGEPLQTIAIDPANAAPVVLDLRSKLSANGNMLEVRGTSGIPLMVSTVATHYVRWQDIPASQSRDLKLDYRCDKTEAVIMTEIRCSVESTRLTRNYGMLLAEIGLPPGVDVSRESLDTAVSEQVISRYDILPDRLVIYFWARSGGTKLNFSFRPRYGIEAQTPPSIVYDYYNPDSHALVPPLKFSIK